MQQIEFFGLNSIDNLKKILKTENTKNVFLVTGKSSYETCFAKQKLEGFLKNIGVGWQRFSDFTPNPKIKEIEIGLSMFRKSGPYDMIIGIGGGSAIDVAKSIKNQVFSDYEKLPLVAIPTTAGSGSEATYFIVSYKGRKKLSKGNPDITYPDYTIIDPQFTLSLPKNIAASTGLDALSQAVEAYWSISSTQESKEFAKEAIGLLIRNLEGAINNPTGENKENVMKAANLAGKAINISKTTACHSVAYPITSYFNIPHGHATALTLGEMLVYNSQVKDNDCLDKRGADYVKQITNELCSLLGKPTPEQAREKINELIQSIGLKTKFSELGLKKSDIEIILENGFAPERVKNNPRLLTEDNLSDILYRIY